MQTTIGSYKNIIEQIQSGDTQSVSKFKVEIDVMQKEIQSLESQRNKMLQKEKIMEDEKAS